MVALIVGAVGVATIMIISFWNAGRKSASVAPLVRGEPGVVGDGDGADDGQSEAVVVIDADAVGQPNRRVRREAETSSWAERHT